jgi:hypothetical protein
VAQNVKTPHKKCWPFDQTQITILKELHSSIHAKINGKNSTRFSVILFYIYVLEGIEAQRITRK